MKNDREILKQRLTKSTVLTLVKWKNQAYEFCIVGWRRWSLHLVDFFAATLKIWKFDQSVDFAENFDRMRCKTKTFGKDSHKKL